MSERPPILAHGKIVAVREPGRLFDVQMENGYVAIAVLPKDGPQCPPGDDPIGLTIKAAFSPYDMSRCKVIDWDLG